MGSNIENFTPASVPSSPKVSSREGGGMMIVFVPAIVTTFVAVSVIVSVIMFIWICKITRRTTRIKERTGSVIPGEQEQSDPLREWTTQMLSLPDSFTYKQLSAATSGFAQKNVLGVGGFGSVYRGVLPGVGTVVAIKRLDRGSEQGVQEFMAEVKTITNIRHRNIVCLMGWCKHERKHRVMLVYEFMPNGSLDKALFNNSPSSSLLSWGQRFKIVYGIAAALDYLHEGWNQKVIHRDVKSSNIMLDAEFCAKLGDFGLARMKTHQKSLTTTDAAGTYGYIAPEAAFFGKYTEKTDVFAFGAVALEIACGRMAFDRRLPKVESVLKDWVNTCLSGGDLMRAVDQRLGGAYDDFEMQSVLLLGLVCSDKNPVGRPSMRQVLQVLSRESPILPGAMSKVPGAVPLPQIRFQDLLRIAGHRGQKS